MVLRPVVIRRLLAGLSRRPPEVRREATVMITLYGPQGAWPEAYNRWRMAREDTRWRESQLLRRRGRHWNSVMHEIERQRGYRHQPDTASGTEEQ